MPSATLATAMATPAVTKEAAAAAAPQPAAGGGTAVEESSRVFVKNLPPNITEDQLRKHFGAGGRHITDLRLIARRRIAFVGYRTPDEAQGAVRYFHRSFIRLSKLSVELAKPISDPSLPTAQKMRRLHEMHGEGAEAAAASPAAPAAKPALQPAAAAAAAAPLAADAAAAKDAKKRKRDDLDVAKNPKLREFLDVMQAQNKGLSSTADVFAAATAAEEEEKERAAAAALLAEAEAESDDEYETLPAAKKPKAAAGTGTAMDEDEGVDEDKATGEARPTRVAAITATSIEEEAVASGNGGEETKDAPRPAPQANTAMTDDDWLRSRTNRLLDLLDPSELPAPEPATTQPAARPAAPARDRQENGIQVYDREKDDDEDVDDGDDAKNEEKDTADAAAAATPAPAPAADAAPSAPPSAEEQILQTSRLFVRNLPYDATEEHLRAYFSALGAVQEVQLPTTNAGANKGYAMVQFAEAAAALAAFHNADGKTFQGRILHVLPAKAKKSAADTAGAVIGPGGALDEFALAKLPLKQQRLLRKKAEAATSTFSWNALFMSPDAVNAAMAERLGVSKSAMLDPTSSDEAVRLAVRQTALVEETKDYFAANGVDLEAFRTAGAGAGAVKRGDTCILAKNFAYGTTSQQLRALFEEYGPVVRVLMPPGGTLAIVQFAQAAHGRLAYSKLAYRRIDDTVLLLEKCPENLLPTAGLLATEATAGGAAGGGKTKLAASDLLDGDAEGQDGSGAAVDGGAGSEAASSLFVRNLNFTTTTEQLAAAFSGLDGFVSARVKTKADAKKPGQVLSMGYGFVAFRTAAQAAAACQAMDGHVLQGHTLTVRASHRGAQDAAEAQRAADRAQKLAANRGSKLVIKNVPFEVTRKDLRTLLGTYGQLRAVRMPKKFGNSTRGYAFAEFVTAREAAAAMAALRNTHLLGRRLVLEFAEAEALDAEEEIAKMQKKVGAQVDSVAMQQLATSRTHRTKVQIGEEGAEEM